MRKYSLVKHALELKKPVMMINLGPSRADDLSGIEKLDVSTSLIMNEIARAVMWVKSFVFSTHSRSRCI